MKSKPIKIQIEIPEILYKQLIKECKRVTKDMQETIIEILFEYIFNVYDNKKVDFDTVMTRIEHGLGKMLL